jgi:hypothetical protein
LLQGPFGGVLAGEFSPRVVLQRSALLVQFGGEALPDLPALADGSPLRWLAADAGGVAGDGKGAVTAARMAWRRGWVAAAARDAAAARLSTFDDTLHAAGLLVPAAGGDIPLRTLLANVTTLARDVATATALLRRTGRLLAADPQHGEARLLQGLVQHLSGDPAAAARTLAPHLDETDDDLRARYLLAVAARDAGDRDLLRLALRRGRTTIRACDLDAAALALPWRAPVSGAALLDDAR